MVKEIFQQKNGWKRFLHSTLFSLIVLAILVSVLAYIAWRVTESLKDEPDFGGMISLRQSDMSLSSDTRDYLTGAMIYEFITKKDVLLPIAEANGWNIEYEKMLDLIDVKRQLSSGNCFLIIVDTGNLDRSIKIAKELTLHFLTYYQQQWTAKSQQHLDDCDKRIAVLEKELNALLQLRKTTHTTARLNPLSTEVEMQSISDQLVQAQNQFFEAYSAYITSMFAKQRELELELEVAQKFFTEKDVKIRTLRRQLEVFTVRCNQLHKQLDEQKPDVYTMQLDPPKLTGYPDDVVYFYENVQSLQKMKLAMLLPSLIKEKEKDLEYEQKRKQALERLLSSNSCDVYIREVGQ